MANAHSKVLQEKYNEKDTYYPQQKLVLYIEECDKVTGKDMSCFIMYDDYQEEYLINGMRGTSSKFENQHTFYCKKRKQLVNYLKSVFDETHVLNTALYNYSNDDDDQLYESNFEKLYSIKLGKDVGYEITGYDACPVTQFNTWEKINRILKCLKYVRY